MLWLRLLATQWIPRRFVLVLKGFGKFAALLPREPCSRFLFIDERYYLAEPPGYRFYSPREIMHRETLSLTVLICGLFDVAVEEVAEKPAL